MSVQERPVDNITVDYLQLGIPFVEWSPALTGGGYGPYRNVGIIDTASLEKTINTIELRDASSGISVIKRELINEFDASLLVEIFQHTGDNMQLIFASQTLTAVSEDAAAAVVGDIFTLSDDAGDFVAMGNQLIDESTVVITCATIVAEAVGTGDGLAGSGAVSGDFALAYKVSDSDVDVTSVTAGGVVYAVVDAATSTANEVVIDEGATATSGNMQFFDATGTPVNVVGDVVATYTPGFTFVVADDSQLGDYTLNGKDGTVRFFNIGATGDALKFNQPMSADYNYNRIAYDEINPYTQFVFEGRLRIRLLTDVGINMIWPVPKAQVKLTETAFEFDREEFGSSELEIKMLDAGGSAPFGIMELYQETP